MKEMLSEFEDDLQILRDRMDIFKDFHNVDLQNRACKEDACNIPLDFLYNVVLGHIDHALDKLGQVKENI